MPSTEFVRIPDGLIVQGDLIVVGAFSIPAGAVRNATVASDAEIARTKLALDSLRSFPIELTRLRVWDAITSLLPSAAAADDLALIGGTFGGASPSVRTSDAKDTSITQRARLLVHLPESFETGGNLRLRLRAGMITTVANGTATVDVEAYQSDKEGGVGSDLVATDATTINSLDFANIDFVISAGALSAGAWLDIRITIAITDASTATAVIGALGSIELLADIRG